MGDGIFGALLLDGAGEGAEDGDEGVDGEDAPLLLLPKLVKSLFIVWPVFTPERKPPVAEVEAGDGVEGVEGVLWLILRSALLFCLLAKNAW